MVCRDSEGGWYATDTVNFTTATPSTSAPQLAAVHIPGVQIDRLNRGMLSSRPSKGVSPHLLMGISCILLSLLLLCITTILIVKRYKDTGQIVQDSFTVEEVGDS